MYCFFEDMIPFMPPTLTYRMMNAWKHAIFPYLGAGVESCCAYAPSFYRGFDGAQHPVGSWNRSHATKTERRAVPKGVSLALRNLVLGIFASEHGDCKSYYCCYHSFSVSCSCCCDVSQPQS